MSDAGPGERSAPEGAGGQQLPPPSLSPYGAPPVGPPPASGAAPPPPPPPGYNPYAPAYTYATPPSAEGPAPGLRYAGFGIRTLAYLIDALVLGVAVALAAIPLGGLTRDGTTTITGNGTVITVTTVPTANPSLQLFGLLAGAVYFVIAWGFFARTLGMRALRLQVLRVSDGGHIGIGRALLRYLGLLVSFTCAFLGVIWVALDPRRQGWHDKIAGTFVVQDIRPRA